MFNILTSSSKELLAFQKKVARRRGRRKRRRFKQRIYWRDGGICQYCFKPVEFAKSTLDHITPLVHGGSDTHKENFTIACFPCNKQKAQLLLEELEDLEPTQLKDKFDAVVKKLNPEPVAKVMGKRIG